MTLFVIKIIIIHRIWQLWRIVCSRTSTQRSASSRNSGGKLSGYENTNSFQLLPRRVRENKSNPNLVYLHKWLSLWRLTGATKRMRRLLWICRESSILIWLFHFGFSIIICHFNLGYGKHCRRARSVIDFCGRTNMKVIRWHAGTYWQRIKRRESGTRNIWARISVCYIICRKRANNTNIQKTSRKAQGPPRNPKGYDSWGRRYVESQTHTHTHTHV